MTIESDQIGPNEAQDALNTIQSMESAGLQRGLPPRWFGLAMALPAGVLFALAGLEISRLYMAPIFLLMVFAVIYQIRKAGVLVKPYPSRRALILVVVGVVAILAPLIFIARELRDTFGFLAPLSLGVIVALASLCAFVLERRAYLTKIKAGKTE